MLLLELSYVYIWHGNQGLYLCISQKSRAYKEVVEIRQRNTGSPRPPGRQRAVPPPPLRTSAAAGRSEQQQQQQHHRQQNWTNGETKITKFRKTVWGVFVVTHDFDPLDENEIAIRTGEHVSVWNQDDRDWFWVVKHTSSGQEEGFVPSGCLREVSADSKISVRCELSKIATTACVSVVLIPLVSVDYPVCILSFTLFLSLSIPLFGADYQVHVMFISFYLFSLSILFLSVSSSLSFSFFLFLPLSHSLSSWKFSLPHPYRCHSSGWEFQTGGHHSRPHAPPNQLPGLTPLKPHPPVTPTTAPPLLRRDESQQQPA